MPIFLLFQLLSCLDFLLVLAYFIVFYLYWYMDFNNLHNHYKDVDFKKGFKKPLPYLIILFILIVFSILYYLDS